MPEVKEVNPESTEEMIKPAPKDFEKMVREHQEKAAIEIEPLLQFFQYAHLPAHLQIVSQRFSLLADEIVQLPRNPERTVALRKLLEAKDCAVRAVIFKS